MVSDDFTALAAISMGALASAAVTLSLTLIPAEPREVFGIPGAQPDLPVAVSCLRRGPVDFAIIREEVEVMVGPEDEETGWEPATSLELRLLRGR